MSGGSLDYFFTILEEHVGDFEDKELDDLVKDLAALFHDREWYLSSDTCKGAWIESRDAFKKKWFTKLGREERIEKYLKEIRMEILDSFGISDSYCMNCKYWTHEDDPEGPYGWCEKIKGCMRHRHESCEDFEKEAKL